MLRRRNTAGVMTNLDESLAITEPTGRPGSLSDRTLVTARQVLAGQRLAETAFLRRPFDHLFGTLQPPFKGLAERRCNGSRQNT